jgi:adenosyl cobinamide kinase/adenosyl cobinamide phosphate guanylyltransferase
MIFTHDKVSFMGFDVQHVKSPADSLLAFLAEKDVILKDSVSAWLKNLTANESQHYMATDSVKKNWFGFLKIYSGHFFKKKRLVIESRRSCG